MIWPSSEEHIVFSMFVLKLHRRIEVKELSHTTCSRFWKDLLRDGSLTINTTKVPLLKLKQVICMVSKLGYTNVIREKEKENAKEDNIETLFLSIV